MTMTANPLLTEFQCRWCWTLVKPEDPEAVEHPGLGLIHGRCARMVRWDHGLPGVDPIRFLDDLGDQGKTLT